MIYRFNITVESKGLKVGCVPPEELKARLDELVLWGVKKDEIAITISSITSSDERCE